MPSKDEEQWWRRQGTAKRGFHYTGANGRRLTGAATLERIRRMAIPPAWTDVHISPDPERKVQVWGYDAAGRKQYRYAASHVAKQVPRRRNGWRSNERHCPQRNVIARTESLLATARLPPR